MSDPRLTIDLDGPALQFLIELRDQLDIGTPARASVALSAARSHQNERWARASGHPDIAVKEMLHRFHLVAVLSAGETS